MADVVSTKAEIIEITSQGSLEPSKNLIPDCSEPISNLTDECSKVSEAEALATSDISEAISSGASNISNSIVSSFTEAHVSWNGYSSQISDAIIQSNDKLTSTAIFFAIFVAILGALSAFLFNYFHWRIVRKTDKLYNVGSELKDLIKDLEDEALRYWVSSYASSRKEDVSISEISIKSMIRQVELQTKTLIELSGEKKLNSKKEKIENFPSEIFDLITGGDFESKSRVPSNVTAMKVAKKCSDARANIASVIMYI
jgi:hypothetical protein